MKRCAPLHLTALIAALGALNVIPVRGADVETSKRRPTLFLIGDSTVKNGSGKGDGSLWGWGDFLASHFDPAKITVENRARGGRSSRTFLTEGLWDKVLLDIHPGDVVMMQFGHNDGGPIDSGKARASLKGNGDETKDVKVELAGTLQGSKNETVHTYGWYLRRYCADAKAKGAVPIVLSPVPRNMWKDNKVLRAIEYAKWAAIAAEAAGAEFIDLNEIVAKQYDALGADKVLAQYFTAADHTHTVEAGAKVNAASVVEGIKELTDCPLKKFLKP